MVFCQLSRAHPNGRYPIEGFCVRLTYEILMKAHHAHTNVYTTDVYAKMMLLGDATRSNTTTSRPQIG